MCSVSTSYVVVIELGPSSPMVILQFPYCTYVRERQEKQCTVVFVELERQSDNICGKDNGWFRLVPVDYGLLGAVPQLTADIKTVPCGG